VHDSDASCPLFLHLPAGTLAFLSKNNLIPIAEKAIESKIIPIINNCIMFFNI